jgi:precorrin-2 dehydrogenase/sirohydrochlorin ferrochelatase
VSYLVNLAVRGRPAVVVGGGGVAARKIDGLLEAGASVTVIAPQACASVRALAEAGRIRLHSRDYVAEDVRGACLVVAATDNEEVNARVAADATSAGILVNVVDRPALCSFTIPAVVRRGDLTLAVATEGRCPAFARALREDLERRYGPEYEETLRRLAEIRDRLREAGWDSARIQAALSDIVRAGLVALVASGDQERIQRLIESRLGGTAASR